jgi:hypothetical protein
MVGVLLAFLSSPGVSANRLESAFQAAAARHHVPVEVLEAIGWEATRWNQTAFTIWRGHGIMDLQEGDRDPSLEHAALLLGVSPDLLMRDAWWNIQGGAAILAYQARLAGHGRTPSADDPVAWWDAVRAFSKSDDPTTQALYATTIFDVINTGAEADTAWGRTRLRRAAVNHWDLVPVLPSCTACDYDATAAFLPASAENYSDGSRRGTDISTVVIHTVQGSTSGCVAWFQDPSAGASAHYVIRASDGRIIQMVREEDVAWHAGNWAYNLRSIGIEHEGYVDLPSFDTDAMYRSSAALVSDILSRTHVRADRAHILGHNEIPGATHADPGTTWDWDYYMSLISRGTVSAAGNILGVVSAFDIYNGERIPGATVWLDSGEEVTSDENGVFRFDDEPLASFTIHAMADGYREGRCACDVSGSGDWWCSIALQPDDGAADAGAARPPHRIVSVPTDTGDDDTGLSDTGAAVDPAIGHDTVGFPRDVETCGPRRTTRLVDGLVGAFSVLIVLARRRRPAPTCPRA